MFGSIGGPEILLILGLALLLFGPRRLPDIGRQIGKTLGEFRKAATDFKQDLEREVRTEELRDTGSELKSVSREIDRSVDPAPDRRFDPPSRTPDGSGSPER